MMGSVDVIEPTLPGVKLPRQQRSREAWARVLEAGVGILESDGYHAFTIAAICDRAGVAPRFIYDRVDDKDALFLAVYEHRLQAIRVEQDVLVDEDHWASFTPSALVRAAVDEVGQRFRRHSRFLRTVVLTSSEHAELRARGSAYKSEFEQQFVDRVSSVAASMIDTSPEAAIRLCFDIVFSTWVVRIAYGPGFAAPTLDDRALSVALGNVAVRSLLGPIPEVTGVH